MNKIAAALLLSLGMASAHAVPIVFTSSTYTTFAFSDVDGVTDGPNFATATLPSDTLPISSSASVIAAGGQAESNAMADSLFLSAGTGANSTTGALSSADAVTTFFGTFNTPGGVLSLLMDFEDTTATGGAGLAGSTFAVSLVVDGSSLFDKSFSSTELINNDFVVPAGLLGELEITLISFASSSVDSGAASNLATASFAVIPEPAPLALFLGGLGLLGLSRRFGARARAR